MAETPPAIGQPMRDSQGRPVLDLQGRPVIYHGPLANVQRDAQNRTVWTYQDGTRVYAQPTDAQGHILPAPDSGGVWRENPTFNANTGEYEQGGVDWGNVLGLAVGSVIGAGALAPAAAAGGSAVGPSTAANMAATSTIAGGSTVPPALAAGAGTTMAATSAIPWSTIVGAGTQLFGNLFAAHEQSSAADQAAQIQAAALKYSADLQAKANADALKFQYASAENSYQNNEAARQGNYGIFAARERRLGSIGDEVGMGPREIPAYVPGVDPGFGSVGDAAAGSSASAPPAPGASAATNPSDPNAIMAAVTDNYQKLGVAPTGPGSGPTDAAYMAQKIAETGGLTANNISYWFGPQGRIAAELAKANGGASAPAAASAAPPYQPKASTTATPFMPATIAPGVPQNIGFYA